MRLKGTPAQEFRFQTIVRLKEQGKSQIEIAHLVNCSQCWVSKILKRHATEGEKGLKVKGKAPGKKPGLTKANLEQLKSYLQQGALHYGFPTDNWTRERIAQLIKRQFGVSHHPAHISRIMKKIGFSRQKPRARSYRKDDQEVKEWKEKKLPSLKKSPR